MIQMAMGGSERLVFNLIRNLDRRLFAPSVAWFIREQPLKEFQDLQIPMYYVPKTGRFDWQAMRMISRIVREHEVDVINAHHFMSFVYTYYAARIANRIGLVYTEHSESDVLSVAGKWRTVGTHLLPSCEVVGVTERVSQTLASHFRLPSERVHTIENGVDVELFGRGAEERARVRNRFGYRPQDILIGQVANFRKNKNHLFLLRAFREIARHRDKARLLFIGQGFPDDPENSEPEIKSYIQDHGLGDKVRLMGYRSDVSELLGIMDIFCLVSYKEGLPLSLLEAMASGLPVLGTNIEAIRAVIQSDVNGLVVRPDDDSALTLALERLIGDEGLRLRMGTASQRIASDKYALRRCIEDTQRLLSSMVLGRAVDLSSPVTAVD